LKFDDVIFFSCNNGSEVGKRQSFKAVVLMIMMNMFLFPLLELYSVPTVSWPCSIQACVHPVKRKGATSHKEMYLGMPKSCRESFDIL